MVKESRLYLLAVASGFILAFGLSSPSAADTVDIAVPWSQEKAVQYALANSPDSQAAYFRLRAAAAASRQAKAPFYPQLNISGGYAATDTPMFSFGNILNQGEFSNAIDFNDPGGTDNLDLKAEVRYRLYNGGSSLAGLQAARAMEKGSVMELAALHNRLTFEVLRAFWTIVQARGMVEARGAAVATLEKSLHTAQARYQAGSLLKVEVTTLAAQLAAAQEKRIAGDHDLLLAQRVFINLLGLEYAPFSLEVPPETSDGRGEPDIEGIAPQRPEIRTADARVRAAEARLLQARGGHLPTVDLFANQRFEKGFETGGNGNSWMAGIRLNLPVFDGFLTSSREDEARAQLAVAEQMRRQTVLAIDLEIERARLALEEAEQRLEVSRKMIEEASESARLNRARFKAGLVLAADLIDAENRYTEAQVSQVVAGAARHIALADLRRALGVQQGPQTNDGRSIHE